MARELRNKTNVTAPGGNYPYGRAKDNSGSNDGTPVNEQLLGDLLQFFEKIMDEGGVTFNEAPENSSDGFQYFVALQAIIQSFIDDLKDGVPVAGDTLDKLYTLVTSLGRPRGGWDASSNTVPGSASNEIGDFWRITVAGTLSGLVSGAGDVKPGDIIIADIAGATNQVDFYCVQSNVDQATTSTFGLVKLYTNVTDSNTDGAPSQNAVRGGLFTKPDIYLSSFSDFDNLTTPMSTVFFYASSGGPSNGPGANFDKYYELRVSKGPSNRIGQVMCGLDVSKIYSRVFVSPAWSAWTTVV